MLHDHFQFQLVHVDTTTLEKAEQFFGAMLHHGKPDDLAGALGGFGMYAAVAEARFRPGFMGAIGVEITKVAIYVKNPYSFFDDPSQGGSQYLGHWNRDGILLVPESYKKATLRSVKTGRTGAGTLSSLKDPMDVHSGPSTTATSAAGKIPIMPAATWFCFLIAVS